MKLLAFLSLFAMGGGDISVEAVTATGGDRFIKVHNDTRVQQFCEINWDYSTEHFWLRPQGHSEWMLVEGIYEIVCGSFVPDPDDGVQLGGPDIEQGG